MGIRRPWLAREQSAARRAASATLAALLLVAAVLIPSAGWLNPLCATEPAMASPAPAPASSCRLEAPPSGAAPVSGAAAAVLPGAAVVESGAPNDRPALVVRDDAPPAGRAIRPLLPPPIPTA